MEPMRFLAATLCALVLGSASVAAPPPIPSEWFFDGENRPAPLRDLEGKPAPELEVESWIGDSVKLSEQRGKVVVVDFWATWCGPCMAAIPENVELVKKHKDDGLVFIGVHDANAGFDKAPQVVKDKKINYPVAKDVSGGRSAGAYRLQFWPTYVVIDRAGNVRAAGLMPQNVSKVVEMLLKEAAPAGGAAESGLAAENYLGGMKRPAALRAIEGRPAAKLAAETWIGTAPAANWRDAWRNSVVVLHFTQASGDLASRELERFARISDEFASQGVVFAAIADPHSDPKALAAMAETAKYGAPFAVDLAPDAAAAAAPAGDAPAATATTATATTETNASSSATSKAKPQGVTAAAYGVQFAPTTIVIDRAGNVRAAGIRLDRAKALLESLLAEPIPAQPAPTTN